MIIFWHRHKLSSRQQVGRARTPTSVHKWSTRGHFHAPSVLNITVPHVLGPAASVLRRVVVDVYRWRRHVSALALGVAPNRPRALNLRRLHERSRTRRGPHAKCKKNGPSNIKIADGHSVTLGWHRFQNVAPKRDATTGYELLGAAGMPYPNCGLQRDTQLGDQTESRKHTPQLGWASRFE